MFNRIETFVNENSLRVSLTLAFGALLLIGYSFVNAATGGGGVFCAEASGENCDSRLESLHVETQEIDAGTLIYDAAVIPMCAESGTTDFLDAILTAFTGDEVTLGISEDCVSDVITINSDCTSPAVGALCTYDDQPLIIQGLNFFARFLKREGSDYWVEISRSGSVPYGNPSATAYHNATFALPNGLWTVIPLNSEIDDPLGWHSTSSNNSRFYVDKSGNYKVTVQNLRVASAGTGRYIVMVKDSGGNGWNAGETYSAGGSSYFTVSAQRHINEGAYIYAQVYQNSGVAKNLDAYFKVTVTYINDQ